MQKYQSKDFYLSSFLLCAGCNLIDTPVSNGVTTFTFEEDEILNKLVQEFYSLRASVEPTKYANSIKTLKTILHNSKSNANSGINSNGFNNNTKGSIQLQ